ncbi:hypothetical protein PUNSTDRAFT_146104 [Punctularia strigosozonata HHB-11173 SS5]|uniref:Uncharacterized protein n=1 Tax=Punctularia strigosozonata (strain HHB-11173) TaxID=741275 RepID=R7S4G4_PUNST|nr:uncharacterized protein PUNSTDRAFT_146104 [Punctularia strigosozonata HHB-11173 SS5]EIN05265.1 hypothetical protein PUNSTDRAFT_146104 [Punctularia strigosozonata HHB-11173 SS5]
MPGMASDMSQGSSSQRQALSRDKPLHAAVRHPSARHGTMPAPDAFTGSRICSTDVLGIGPRSQLHAASGDVAAHTVSKQLRSGGRNLSSRAVVMLSEDEDDPWLKEVDASAWLKGPSAADSDDASEADTVRYSHGEESDSGSSDEEDVTPPRYKKGKFGIFASAGHHSQTRSRSAIEQRANGVLPWMHPLLPDGSQRAGVGAW